MDAEPNAWFAGPVAGSASTRTPSTYISGWFESEKLEAPRMRIREPLPTAPVARCMTTPAARALSRSCTPSMGAFCVTSAALMLEIALPILPISVALEVPVTTTCDSSSPFTSSASRKFVSPTFTVSVAARKPMRRICRTAVVPGTSSKWNRPLASVKARRAVPVTATCASPTGAPEPRLTTVPATEPPCAATIAGATIPNVRARLHRTEEHRMPRPRERGGCLYYRHEREPQGRGPYIGHRVPRWRAASRNDMFSSSISVGARMPVRFLTLALLISPVALAGQRTQKPPLHGRHWVAITGKPLAATAGAMIFQKGGNPVDAACAMLAAVTTMWDVLSWGGETQALIYNPQTKKVIAINALGVAPTGATPAFYRSKGMHFPPEYGPLAAITPGTPGRLRPVLQGRHRAGIRPRTTRGRGTRHAARPGGLEGEDRRARHDDLSRHRRLQATALVARARDARGAEYPRDLRSQGHGLQQRALHPHRVPGDEPRVRGPRLLLRRPRVPAGGADPRLALEGLRAATRAPDQSRPQRPGHQAG